MTYAFDWFMIVLIIKISWMACNRKTITEAEKVKYRQYNRGRNLTMLNCLPRLLKRRREK